MNNLTEVVNILAILSKEHSRLQRIATFLAWAIALSVVVLVVLVSSWSSWHLPRIPMFILAIPLALLFLKATRVAEERDRIRDTCLPLASGLQEVYELRPHRNGYNLPTEKYPARRVIGWAEVDQQEARDFANFASILNEHDIEIVI